MLRETRAREPAHSISQEVAVVLASSRSSLNAGMVLARA